MLDSKTIFGILSLIFVFVVYIPYIRDILKGKTKPHVFSWFVWGLTTFIIYALQVKGGAGPGSWATLLVGVIMFIILFLGLKQGNKNIKRIDIVFLVLSLIALLLWVLVKQPVLSIILLAAVEMLAFVPTFRKSWEEPYSETLFSYVANIFRQVFSFQALVFYSIITWLIPVSWAVMNTLFVVAMVIRRKKKNLVLK